MWKQPWGYKESFLISFELLVLGFIIEILNQGRSFVSLQWPANLFVGLSFIAILAVIHLRFRKMKFFKWLSSVPAAISSISLFCLLSLLLGFLPQDPDVVPAFVNLLGLSHVQRSWPFLLSGIYLLVVLGLVTLRRLRPINQKNIGFFVNHAGLWITLLAIILGSGDLKRLKISLQENSNPKDIAFDNRQKTYKIPFKLKLLNFDIEEYPPKLALIESGTGKFVEGASNNLTMVEEKLDLPIGNWQVKVEKYIYNAMQKDSTYIPTKIFGAGPAVYISVENLGNGKTAQGWLSPGSIRNPFQQLELNENHSFALAQPEAKVYSSDVVIFDAGQAVDTTRIEVNKPFTYKGWKLYQVGYDDKMGRWSKTSVLEAVFDPWLLIVYIGIFMLIAGGAYMIWIGKDK